MIDHVKYLWECESKPNSSNIHLNQRGSQAGGSRSGNPALPDSPNVYKVQHNQGRPMYITQRNSPGIAMMAQSEQPGDESPLNSKIYSMLWKIHRQDILSIVWQDPTQLRILAHSISKRNGRTENWLFYLNNIDI